MGKIVFRKKQNQQNDVRVKVNERGAVRPIFQKQYRLLSYIRERRGSYGRVVILKPVGLYD